MVQKCWHQNFAVRAMFFCGRSQRINITVYYISVYSVFIILGIDISALNFLGAGLLRLYCVYIVIIALNGITECFTMATMTTYQVLFLKYFNVFLNIYLQFAVVFSWLVLFCHFTSSYNFFIAVFILYRCLRLNFSQHFKHVNENCIQVWVFFINFFGSFAL